jgi:hypothetical protein
MDSSDGSNQPQDSSGLLELCWAMFEGTASEVDIARWNELMAAGSENRRDYVLFMQVIASLEHEFAQPSNGLDGAGTPPIPIVLSPADDSLLGSDSMPPLPLSPSSRSFWQNAKSLFAAPFPMAVCGATFTLLAVFAFRGFDIPGRGPQVVQAEKVAIAPVAYLVSTNGCAWRSNSLQSDAIDRSIRSGEEIVLQEGIAEFRLSSGIVLSVEGPAALVLTSPDSLMLQFGKLTARVPWEVKDFRLLAGTCRLSATDAEFGVTVSDAGVEVHTFSGDVTVTPSPFAGDSTPAESEDRDFGVDDRLEFEPAIVPAGRSLSFAGEGRSDEQRSGDADRSKFATKLSMAGRLPVSQDYVDAVLESRPIGYWRFESVNDTKVSNEIDGGPSLLVVGEVSLVGDETNRVAELSRPQTSGHFQTEGPISQLSGTTSYSVEMWIKPSHFHRGVLAGLVTDNDDPKIAQPEKHGFMLELQRGYESRIHPPGSLRFLHRNPPGIRLGTSCYSNRLYGLRRWQHVVAVKQKSNMRLYVDGKVVATAEDKTSLAKDLRLVVGQTFSNQSVNPYIGQLDELAIYNRALAESEIQNRCEAIQLLRQAEPDS